MKLGVADLIRGVRRDRKKFTVVWFAVFSGLFTIASAVDFFVPGAKLKEPWALLVVALIGLLYAVHTVWKPSKVEMQVANCGTCIEILFADLFALDGVRAIAVNEFFDSRIGRPVSPRSLHGMLITQCFGGHQQPFDDQVSAELAGLQPVPVPTKVEGKTERYPIGTTALITSNSDQYLLFALTHTDPATCKASADVTQLWDSINAMWKRARIECNGLPLNVPLIGSGPSGIGLPTRDLLNLIVLSAIVETKASEITKRIRIVLHKDRFDDLDLRDVRSYWKDK
jgi:hypothetical protein